MLRYLEPKLTQSSCNPKKKRTERHPPRPPPHLEAVLLEDERALEVVLWPRWESGGASFSLGVLYINRGRRVRKRGSVSTSQMLRHRAPVSPGLCPSDTRVQG